MSVVTLKALENEKKMDLPKCICQYTIMFEQ